MKKSNTKNTKWNLDQLKNKNDPDFLKERERIKKNNSAFIKKWKSRDDYLKDPAILRQALAEFEKLLKTDSPGGNEDYYYSLSHSLEQDNPKIKAQLNIISDYTTKIGNDMEFFTLRISKIDKKNQKKFLDYPGLAEYRHGLKKAFDEAKYLLTEPEEKILNLKSKTSYSNWVRMLSSFLVKEEETVYTESKKIEKKSFTEIPSLMNNRNKKIRDSAAIAFNKILEKHLDTAENELNSVLENKKVDDELRCIERPDKARHLADDVDTKVVDTLIEEVSNGFDIPKKYYRLKAKMMGVKRLKYHERNVPIGNIIKKYSFSDSVDLVFDVFDGLDKEFTNIFHKLLAQGNIDAFPKKGKSGGAFCANRQITQPTFVLLNHTDELQDVLTMAHEMGHAINSELMKNEQNALTYGTPLSTAEVASTFMEDYVLQEILKTADEQLRLSLMMMKLNDDVSTIFRQIACYRFEQELHKDFRKQGYLSKQEIGSLFSKHMAGYMGSYVSQDKGSENWWVYWSHIRHFFYNYSYASGLLISKSMQASVKKDHRFISKVKDFLSAGTSDSPKNIMKKLGIDIGKKEFWQQGLKEIEDLLVETEGLAKKLGKI
ncbi:MAG: M3 family oligoendopeptidase [Nanoarchaeota archaeon]|nr:M3 family oligoendopeptidase [Nanoarchaeota archaeon]